MVHPLDLGSRLWSVWRKRSNFTSEKQKKNDEQQSRHKPAKIKMVEHHYSSNYWFLPLYDGMLSAAIILMWTPERAGREPNSQKVKTEPCEKCKHFSPK